jgi:outer membrane lipoprotein-sorting protein
MKKSLLLLVLLSLALPLWGFKAAWAKDLTALEVMKKNLMVTKVNDVQYQTDFILYIPYNKPQKSYRTQEFAKLQKNQRDYMRLMRFTAPAEVKGMEVLWLEHSKGEDEIWVYNPSSRKTHKLSAAEKKSAFLGSEFKYLDFLSPKLNDFTYKILGSELDEGIDCYVIEALPANPAVVQKTGYSRKKALIRKDIFLEMRTDYQDEQGNMLKTLTYHNDIPADKTKHKWFPLLVEMNNHAKQSMSSRVISNVKLNAGIPDAYFDPARLGQKR